jgi:rRNA-processing protein FCF1
MKVVLDSNALIMPFQYSINLDLEIEKIVGSPEIYVPSCVIGELKRLSTKRWEAKAALQLAEKYNVVEVEKMGDEGVVEGAKKLNAVVVTNDRELIERLKREGIKVISLKQNHLVMDYD